MLKEFRDFAIRGNVLDMAVGIIIGAAFGTVVSSLVNDVVMPPIGLAMGGVDFADIRIPVGTGAEGEVVAIGIGLFMNNLISFLIVAFAVFMIVKSFNNIRKLAEKEAAAAPPPPPPAPTAEEALLAEIRDLLRSRPV